MINLLLFQHLKNIFLPIFRQDQQHDAEVLHGAEGQDAQQTDS